MGKNIGEMGRFPYLVNVCYSLGHWLKDYGYYPKELPLFTYMDHGMTLFDKIPMHEVENDAPLIFKFSPRLTKIYKQYSKKPVYNVMNPAIHYRRSRKILPSAEARGALFFVAHSTPLIDDLTDWQVFINDLKKLPEVFHPIDICLHPVDVEKGLGKLFEEKGFKVLSADKVNSTRFLEHFYNNLKNYKYALSNLIGSYTFYAVEMGIPFSLYGEEPKYVNKGDTNIEMGAYESYKGQKTYQQAVHLFSGEYTAITQEQKHFVEYELGMYTTISRWKTAFLLYKAYLQYALKHPRSLTYVKGWLVGKVRKKT